MTEGLEIHLLYASVVWLAAWLLTSMPRGSATAKYWIWVATSINFLLPLGALPGRWWPSRVAWFTASLPLRAPAPGVLWMAWAAGAAFMLARLCLRRDAAAGPRVEGLLRPRICLPDGIDRVLTAEELDAVLIHERRHARRRDNLVGLIHEISVCLLWFHPLVWMTRGRLALYRELSCDELVARRARGAELVSALAKIAYAGDASLLQAGASSFLVPRLKRLSAAHDSALAANVLLAIVFVAVLLCSVVAPVARSAAAYACALTHASR